MKVNVYTHNRTDRFGRITGRPPLVLAYTRYQGEGACVHNIPDAKTGAEAKRRAMAEHRAMCLAPASDERSEEAPR